jgi:hypothetical protein
MLTLLKKEPVLLGTALTATVHGLCLLAGLAAAPTVIVDGIALGWIAWTVRVLSVPVVKADAAVDAARAAGRDAGIADVASLAQVPAAPVTFASGETTTFASGGVISVAPAKKAPAKKAPAKRAPRKAQATPPPDA